MRGRLLRRARSDLARRRARHCSSDVEPIIAISESWTSTEPFAAMAET
jgi:hypothetical protein